MLNLSIFESHKLDSRIKSANVTTKELILGYILGPCGPVIFNLLMGIYLNIYYTDILGTAARLGSWVGFGTFMTILPIASKILDAVTNFIMGAIIDKTRTRQGKLRPYILLSAPLITIAGLLLFWIPKASVTVQIIWVTVSYNAFFAFAYTVYNVSHQLMAAHATYNQSQRVQVSFMARMPTLEGAGIITGILFPMFLYPLMQQKESYWLIIMSAFSIIMLPLTIIEYFYTRERVTEAGLDTSESVKESVPVIEQLKLLVREPAWICFLVVMFLNSVAGTLNTMSFSYFCNWVLAPTYTMGGTVYGILSTLCGVPEIACLFLVIPMAKKFGQEKVVICAFLINALGDIVAFIWHTSILGVALGKMALSLGMVCADTLSMSILANLLDHVELKYGFRPIGLTGSIFSVYTTLCQGLVTGLLNALLFQTGYKAPADLLLADGSYAAQSISVRTMLTVFSFGAGIAVNLIMALLMRHVKLDDKAAETTGKLLAKKKAEAEAEGRTWENPIEAAEREKEAMDAEREAEMLARIKARCESKGLDYNAEVARYKKRKEDGPRREKLSLILLIVACVIIAVAFMVAYGLI